MLYNELKKTYEKSEKCTDNQQLIHINTNSLVYFYCIIVYRYEFINEFD